MILVGSILLGTDRGPRIVIITGAIVLVILGVVPLTPWGVVLIAAAGMVDIGESLFWIWLSKRRKATMGAEALVGEKAEVTRPCHPLGYVRVKGELWQARCEEGADRGDDVRIVGHEGLTLLVERDR